MKFYQIYKMNSQFQKLILNLTAQKAKFYNAEEAKKNNKNKNESSQNKLYVSA